MQSPLVRRFLFVLLLAPLWMLLSDAARAQSPENETDSLYLGNRVMLVSGIPQQLTLNAKIRCFVWSPSGKEIAYVGQSGPKACDTVLAVTHPDGEQPRVFYQSHPDPPSDAADLASGAISRLIGWSPDGKYLAFIVNSIKPHKPNSRYVNAPHQLYVLDPRRGVPAFVATLAWDDARPFRFHALWSPHRDLLAFPSAPKAPDETYLTLYDPAAQSTRTVPLSNHHFIFAGWSDDGKLIVEQSRDALPNRYVAIDPFTYLTVPATLSTMQKSVLRELAVEESHFYDPVRFEAGSIGMVTLQAGGVPKIVQDWRGGGHRESVTLWIVVQPDKPAVSATNGQDASLILRIDSFRAGPAWSEDFHRYVTGFGDTPVALAPNDPVAQKKQIAYLISGDLYVSDVSVRAASIKERVTAGDPLTNLEE